jgi:ribonuclease HII
MPELTFDAQTASQSQVPLTRLCGVDEAGRGPWAGPVVAAAVILDPTQMPSGIGDSKKLSEAARNRLYDEILDSALASCVIMVDAGEIDRLNILRATLLAMTRAVAGLGLAPELALIDGNRAPALSCPAIPIIKGDGKSQAIGAASILAKVTRDRFMWEADLVHSGYGFAQHKGYGVPQHQAALARLGPCPLHRMSFRPLAAWG